MMRSMMVGAALALAGCSGGGSEPGEITKADPEAQAKATANAIMAGVPRDLGGGVSLTGARGEGRVVVVALAGLTDWRPSYTDEQMAGNMKRVMCLQPGVDEALAAGATIRMQSRTTQGRDLPPLVITRC